MIGAASMMALRGLASAIFSPDPVGPWSSVLQAVWYFICDIPAFRMFKNHCSGNGAGAGGEQEYTNADDVQTYGGERNAVNIELQCHMCRLYHGHICEKRADSVWAASCILTVEWKGYK